MSAKCSEGLSHAIAVDREPSGPAATGNQLFVAADQLHEDRLSSPGNNEGLIDEFLREVTSGSSEEAKRACRQITSLGGSVFFKELFNGKRSIVFVLAIATHIREGKNGVASRKFVPLHDEVNKPNTVTVETLKKVIDETKLPLDADRLLKALEANGFVAKGLITRKLADLNSTTELREELLSDPLLPKLTKPKWGLLRDALRKEFVGVFTNTIANVSLRQLEPAITARNFQFKICQIPKRGVGDVPKRPKGM